MKQQPRRHPGLAASLALTGALVACATNPVTGERELTLVSESQEIAIGQQQYAPTRQSQGGDFSVEPGLQAYVAGIGERLAQQSERPQLPYEFTVLANDVPNAWALPGGKIAVNLGLILALEDEAQLAAVLGHEIIHAAARHGARGMERGMLLQGAVQAVAIGTGGDSNAQWVMGAASLGANLIGQKYGRDAETESDLYGMRMMQRAGYDPAAAVELQEVFVRLSAGHQSSWLEGLFASHPPSVERVEANKAELERMRANGLTGGERGAERYARRLVALKGTAAGYSELAQGERELAAGNATRALQLADAAIESQPREARFHALRGKALLSEGRAKESATAYDRALSLDGEYFALYSGRGRALLALGDDRGAAAAFAESAKRLPTVEAEAELGLLAEKSGNLDVALAHYERVAASRSPWSARATERLVRIKLPTEPGAFVLTDTKLDERGFLVIIVENRAPIPVEKVELELIKGGGEPARIALPGRIEAGTASVRRTNIGPLNGREALEKVQVRVVSARPAETD